MRSLSLSLPVSRSLALSVHAHLDLAFNTHARARAPADLRAVRAQTSVQSSDMRVLKRRAALASPPLPPSALNEARRGVAGWLPSASKLCVVRRGDDGTLPSPTGGEARPVVSVVRTGLGVLR